MHRIAAVIASTSFALWSAGAIAAEPQSIVFGQLQLAGGNAVPFAWKLVVRNVDTRDTETITLEKREPTSVLYDFAKALPPGKYHFHMLEAPRVDWGNRITDESQYFELKPGAALYLGNWTIQLGVGTTKTKYSVKYDLNEVGLFAKANPGIEPSRFAIGVLGKPAVPLTTQ